MIEEIKTLQEELQKTVSDFRGYVEKEIAEVKAKGNGDPETKESLAKANNRIDELESLVKRAAAASVDTAHSDQPDVTAYKNAFEQFLRKGIEPSADLHAKIEKTMSVGSDPNGGFLVAPDVTGRIATRIRETTPMRQIAAVQAISTDALEGLNDLDEASSGWVGETDARPNTATPELGKWRIDVHEEYANPRITQKLIDDAAVDVVAWLENKVADRLARRQNGAFVVGDGIAKPRGFAGGYTTAGTADGSRAWGTLEHVNTGTSANFGTTAATKQDKILDLIYTLKADYRAGAVFMTNKQVLAIVRKFKWSGTSEDYGYVWQPSFIAGQPSTLAGYPLIESEDMPALATNSLSLAFGNFREGYQIVDRVGIRVLRDPYSTKPFVQFYTTARVGGGVINFEAIKLMRFGS